MDNWDASDTEEFDKSERQFIVLNALENSLYRAWLWRDSVHKRMNFEEYTEMTVNYLVDQLTAPKILFK
jgi:hypothetical protein